MDTQNIKQQRTRETNVPDMTTSATMRTNKNVYSNIRSRRDKRVAKAKRGVRSLAIAVSIPFSLTLLNIYFFGSTATTSARRGGGVSSNSKAFWFPPLWVLHMTSIVTTFLMSLSAWLVWAEGGFHKRPAAFTLYSAQLALSLAWVPVVFGIGATWLGLMACLAMFGVLVGCYRQFKEVNPIAGDLVKPCLTWAAFLAIVNLEHVFA